MEFVSNHWMTNQKPWPTSVMCTCWSCNAYHIKESVVYRGSAGQIKEETTEECQQISASRQANPGRSSQRRVYLFCNRLQHWREEKLQVTNASPHSQVPCSPHLLHCRVPHNRSSWHLPCHYSILPPWTARKGWQRWTARTWWTARERWKWRSCRTSRTWWARWSAWTERHGRRTWASGPTRTHRCTELYRATTAEGRDPCYTQGGDEYAELL